MFSGMESWFNNGWRIDGKRPTNATKKERKAQSEKDKRNNTDNKNRYKRLVRGCGMFI